MTDKTPLNLTLNTRLWLALAFCILPLFVMTLYDYQKERKTTLRDIEAKGSLILNGALIAEEAAIRQIEMTLQTMANANDLKNLDAQECSGLAQRMQAAHPDLANLGAVTNDGQVFCSGLTRPKIVDVSDREWFIDSRTTEGMTRGQFLIGRISKQPVATFGFPLRNAAGEQVGSLFAASSARWFDRFTRLINLPENWNSLLVSRDGLVISHYPTPETFRGQNLSEENRQRLQSALAQQQSSLIMPGLDGRERLFVINRLSIGKGELIAMVSVPTDTTLAVVDQQFYHRLLVLLVLTATSLLLARQLLRELVDQHFSQTLQELKRLRDALDHVPAFVYMKDKQHRYIYANQKTLDLFGISREQLPGSTDDQFFPPATVDNLHAIDRSVFNGNTTNEIIEVNDDSKTRRIYHEVKTAIYEGPNKALWGLCGISTDITEHYLAEESIRKLSWVIEQSPESIVFTNLKAEIEYVNDAFLKISGYQREEIIGSNPRILQSGQTPPERYTEMWAALSAGQPWRGEFFNKRKDGSEYLEVATISPIRQSDGRITHYAAIKADITEQRQNENELTEYRTGLERLVRERTFELAVAKEAAESASKAKSAFLANMSHEIRTPMNAIIGLNYLLLQSELKAEQADKVRKVSHAAEHLLQIINDILDLSKIEAGKLQLENIAFSPKDVVETVGNMIRERALAKGISLHIASEGLPAHLSGDAMRLRQILLNFAGNAIKFTSHGSITLTAELLADEGETLHCRFAVQDTGIGIRADHIPRLFTPFEQLESSTTRRFGGTGLGLVIARHLSQLMGGEVGVDSTPGVGSTFWITARFARGNGIMAEQESHPQAETRLHGRILLAEDEPINREIATELLSSIGLEVSAVENGMLAVDAFAHGQFDVVLMDLQMPLLDGFGATAQIRGQAAGRDVPIIALTANAFAEDRERCLQAGMTDFLAKPVNPDLLYETLARFLPGERLAASMPAQPRKLLPAEEVIARLHLLNELLTSGNVEANRMHNDLHDSLLELQPEQAAILATMISKYSYEDAADLVAKLLVALEGKAL